MAVFKGGQEDGSQSSGSSCMVIFRAEPVDAARPRVPGGGHGSCPPRASLGAVLVMAQGLWPGSEQGLKSVCPPAPSPSYRRAPTLAQIPGCAGRTCAPVTSSPFTEYQGGLITLSHLSNLTFVCRWARALALSTRAACSSPGALCSPRVFIPHISAGAPALSWHSR